MTDVYTTLVHSSGRYDRSLESLLSSVKRLIHMRGVTLVSGTETKARPTKFLGKNPGWKWVHGVTDDQAADGKDAAYPTRECWVMYSTREWELEGYSTPQIADRTYHGVHGGTLPIARTLRCKFRNRKTGKIFFFYFVHMPTDGTDLRAQIWVEACDGLHAVISRDKEHFPDAAYVIQGDINKNFRQTDERMLMVKHISNPNKLRNAWAGHTPKKGGTHGPLGLIDSIFTNVKVKSAALLPDDASSDHRPFKVRLKVN